MKLLKFEIFSCDWLQIQIHSYNEFPDPSSGSAIERFVSPGQEIFVRVDATSITSERDILGYKAEKRQCLFHDEKKQYDGKYTRSECFMNCKIRSVNALCDCIPFNFPPPIASATLKICTLQHVPCLNKYKSISICMEVLKIHKILNDLNELLSSFP